MDLDAFLIDHEVPGAAHSRSPSQIFRILHWPFHDHLTSWAAWHQEYWQGNNEGIIYTSLLGGGRGLRKWRTRITRERRRRSSPDYRAPKGDPPHTAAHTTYGA